MELLTGLRSTLGIVLQGVPYAMRNVLFNFFMLFLLRVLLRNEWAAAAAFALLWAALGGLSTADHPWSGALISLLRSIDLEVRAFASTEEFLAAPKGAGPSCLVLDVRLRGQSGIAFQTSLAESGGPQ